MQGTAQDWPESVKRLPAHCSFKALDRPDLFATAKAIKPDIFTILRLWDDSLQHYDGNTIDYGRVKAIFENPKPKSQGGHNYGIHIRIGHSHAYESIYTHLSAVGTKLTMLVEHWELIGLAGNTGNSFGAHLHLSVKRHGTFIDPYNKLSTAKLNRQVQSAEDL